MSNYAAPGARVGLQVDGSVTITGGLVIDMTGPSWPDGGEDGETTAIQEGAVNVASGNDTVAFQAGSISGTGDES